MFFGGEGIFKLNVDNFSKILSTGYYVHDIKYNSETGVVVAAGAFDGIHIYNGIEWKSYTGLATGDETSYRGILLIKNKIFCVGLNDSHAKITIGTNY